MCFVAMPYGKRAFASGEPEIDFDAVYEMLKAAIEAEGLECVRADFEVTGGFVHKPMFERLIVAELVVVDLTFANPNVVYELGVRHGASVGATLLVAEREFIKAKKLPFDFAPFRVTPYGTGADGKPEPSEVAAFTGELRKRLALAQQGELSVDNPIVQITQLRPSTVGHEKTDVFLARVQYASDIGRRASEAIALGDRGAALANLQELEHELTKAGSNLRALHTGLLAVYLGYRAKKAFDLMVALYDRMPRELRETPVALEQLALAHNRIAEQKTKDERAKADEHRRRALAALAAIPADKWTSETWGIRGRIHKGKADADPVAAKAELTAAIDAYEKGFRADPRDYFPGVNAVTLRILRNRPEDATVLDALVPVVRFSVERAPEPKTEDERYWQAATRVELATAARDWRAVEAPLDAALAVASKQDWMLETTIANLKRQATARKGEPETVRELEAIIARLSQARSDQGAPG